LEPKLSFKTINFYKKKLFWIFVGTIFFVLFYFLGIVPVMEYISNSKEEISLKRKALLKYEEYLQNRKTIEDELKQILSQFEDIQKRFIPGETPQIGSANLQEMIKRLSEKNGIAIRSFRTLEPKEVLSFKRISIHIEFNPTNSVLNLAQFLYDIEHYERELFISEMDLMVLNPRSPNNIQGSLVISGFIKGDQMKDKEKKGRG